MGFVVGLVAITFWRMYLHRVNGLTQVSSRISDLLLYNAIGIILHLIIQTMTIPIGLAILVSFVWRLLLSSQQLYWYQSIFWFYFREEVVTDLIFCGFITAVDFLIYFHDCYYLVPARLLSILPYFSRIEDYLLLTPYTAPLCLLFWIRDNLHSPVFWKRHLAQTLVGLVVFKIWYELWRFGNYLIHHTFSLRNVGRIILIIITGGLYLPYWFVESMLLEISGKFENFSLSLH